MVTDSHAHLDEQSLSSFLQSYTFRSDSLERFDIITNSVDEKSSLRNLEIAHFSKSVHPFVGIHPQTFLDGVCSKEQIATSVSYIAKLLDRAQGLGEIGLDHKYGEINQQRFLFSEQLELAEKTPVPISIHSRSSTRECLDILSTFNLRAQVLFHWFSGDQEELKKMHDRAYFTSFGPSLLYSKRARSLLFSADRRFILAETDSPLKLDSIGTEFKLNPFFVSSVLFEMSLILQISFEQVSKLNDRNALTYLGTQN